MTDTETATKHALIGRLIETGQMTDAAQEIEYLSSGQGRESLLSKLIIAACEQDDLTFIVRIKERFDLDAIDNDARTALYRIGEDEEMSDDFFQDLPTIVGRQPL